MTDTEREERIKGLAHVIEFYVSLWEATSDFFYRGAADRARMEMEGLIRERSPRQVAQMEVERGLR